MLSSVTRVHSIATQFRCAASGRTSGGSPQNHVTYPTYMHRAIGGETAGALNSATQMDISASTRVKQAAVQVSESEPHKPRFVACAIGTACRALSLPHRVEIGISAT